MTAAIAKCPLGGRTALGWESLQQCTFVEWLFPYGPRFYEVRINFEIKKLQMLLSSEDANYFCPVENITSQDTTPLPCRTLTNSISNLAIF